MELDFSPTDISIKNVEATFIFMDESGAVIAPIVLHGTLPDGRPVTCQRIATFQPVCVGIPAEGEHLRGEQHAR